MDRPRRSPCVRLPQGRQALCCVLFYRALRVSLGSTLHEVVILQPLALQVILEPLYLFANGIKDHEGLFFFLGARYVLI